MVSADMVGAGEWQFADNGGVYENPATVRSTFWVFFQAIKHPLVNVMIEIDKSKSLVYNAACAIDSEPDNAQQFAHMAKACASDMARFASSRSVQFHGGIGFTWECFCAFVFQTANA